jgi:hypothetical protein
MEAGTQFIGIKPNINMQERKSNVANNPTDVFTIEDIASVSRPYKVFSAVFNQYGSDSPETKTDGSLTIGVTYYISNVEDADYGDFTNVGAPDNVIGTYFIATGYEPNEWGKTTLSYDLGAPVANVLENTIGNVWFTYEATGRYYFSSNGLFNGVLAPVKCISFLESEPAFLNIYENNDATIEFVSVTGPGTLSREDGKIQDTFVEIRIYPSPEAV